MPFGARQLTFDTSTRCWEPVGLRFQPIIQTSSRVKDYRILEDEFRYLVYVAFRTYARATIGRLHGTRWMMPQRGTSSDMI